MSVTRAQTHTEPAQKRVFDRKRCGDKLKFRFSDRKKARNHDFGLDVLAAAPCTLLSIIDDSNVSDNNVRYQVLAKQAQKFTHVRLMGKYLTYAELDVGDEVMFNFCEKAHKLPLPRTLTDFLVGPETVAIVLECVEKNTDEALSVYWVRFAHPAFAVCDDFCVLRSQIFYVKRTAEMKEADGPEHVVSHANLQKYF